MHASDPALLLGGHPALNLLNSTRIDGRGSRLTTLDACGDGQCLTVWLQQAQVLPDDMPRRFASLPLAQRTRAAADVQALREAFRCVVQAWTQGEFPDSARRGLAHLNAQLALSPWTARIVHHPADAGSGGGFECLCVHSAPTAQVVLGTLAACCARLLTTVSPQDVRRCANPACSLWFLDQERAPARRWCAMALCGNRAKAAGHRARRKGPME